MNHRPPCARCPDGLSASRGLLVVAAGSQGIAGLGDRANILEGYGNLAASLCLPLVYEDRLCDLLAPWHNHGVVLGCKVEWKRYFASTLSPWFIPQSHGQSAPWVARTGLRLSTAFANLGHATVLSTTGNATNVVQTFVRARTLLARGQRVVWRMEARYHGHRMRHAWDVARLSRADLPPPPRLPFGDGHIATNASEAVCAYVQIGPSRTVAEMMRRSLTAMKVEGLNTTASLHVRRGDVIARCNTSLVAVLRYVRCSVPDVDVAQLRTLLLFTDETQPHYLQALLARLEELWPHVRVHHADVALRRAALPRPHATDNYMVYAAGSAIMAHVAVPLAMTHNRCAGGSVPCGLHRACHPCFQHSLPPQD